MHSADVQCCYKFQVQTTVERREGMGVTAVLEMNLAQIQFIITVTLQEVEENS